MLLSLFHCTSYLSIVSYFFCQQFTVMLSYLYLFNCFRFSSLTVPRYLICITLLVGWFCLVQHWLGCPISSRHTISECHVLSAYFFHTAPVGHLLYSKLSLKPQKLYQTCIKLTFMLYKTHANHLPCYLSSMVTPCNSINTFNNELHWFPVAFSTLSVINLFY